MVVIGFVLIIAAAAAAVILITQNTGSLDVHALGQTWTVNAYWLIVAGLVAMAVAVLGTAMVRYAGVRTYRARREVVRPTAVDERVVTEPTRDTADTAPATTEAPARRSLFRHHPSGV